MSKLTERDYYIWISGVSGFTWRKSTYLLEYFNDYKTLLENWKSEKEIIQCAIGKEVYSLADERLNIDLIKKREEIFLQKNIKILTPADTMYPQSIKNMGYDVPHIITYAGNPALLSGRNIAIVGPRLCTNYASRICYDFAVGLGEAGLTIVSGLATGIDAKAHSAALDYNRPTIAVLGSGLSHVTPSQHTELARKIVRSGGLVISEFEPEFEGSKYSYPTRNRLIAGLCEAVILAEADKKSGSLYTVDHAVEQGKDVFLIPGEIGGVNFDGVVNAYEAGKGEFVVSVSDILCRLGMLTHEAVINKKKGSSTSENSIQLDMTSQKIVDILRAGELNYDSLVEKSAESPKTVLSVLTKLEIFGLIVSNGNVYKLTNKA